MSTVAFPAGVQGTTPLASRIGLPPHLLRRELALMEQLGWATFGRVGRARLVADGQVALVTEWLRKRGLLPRPEQGEAESV